MKKLLLGVITFALIFTSCNKYDDDFAALKASIADLAAKVNGVVKLQTDLTATQAQLTALQTAVAALPAQFTTLSTSLATVNTNLGVITSTLNAVATAGTATKGVVDALTVTLAKVVADKTIADAALNVKLEALRARLALAATSADVKAIETSILAAVAASSLTNDAAVIARIDALKISIEASILAGATDVNSKLAALQVIVDAGNAATMAQIDSVVTSLQGSSTDTATSLTIQGLQLALVAAQKDIATILINTPMNNGNIFLTTDAEVDFFYAKINQLGIVNGNLTVNTAAISAAKKLLVNTILGKIQTVIGVGNSVDITSVAADALALPLLVSVSGNYTVTGADISDPKIDNVGGNVTFNYDGSYESSSLKTVTGNLILVNRVGTTSISFPIVVAAGVKDGVNGAGVLVFPQAASVELYRGVTSLVAVNATSVKLGSTAYPSGLMVTPKSTATIDLSAATSAAGIAITTGTTVNLSNLVTSTGALAITTVAAGTVDLSKFNSNQTVTITGPTTLDFPMWTGGSAAVLTSSTAKTVSMAKHVWDAPAVLTAVENLTLGNVNANVAIDAYATLKVAAITGKTQTKWVSCVAGVTSTGNPALTTLTLGGVMNTVNVSTLPLLTSVTTSGAINSFTLNNAAIITGLTLGHSHFQGDIGFGGPGSYLTITNNSKLASLMPSVLDKMKSLTVTGNALLTSFNFSSYKNLILTGVVSINISGNKVAGTYVAAADKFGTTPSVQAIIKSNSILTLKAYVAAIQAASATGISMSASDVNINVTIPPATTSMLLSAAMLANSTAFTTPDVNLVDNMGGITTFAEWSLVVAE